MSLRTGDSHFDKSGMEEFQDQVAAVPATYIDVSSGFYSVNKQLIYPARPEILVMRRNETVSFAGRHPRRQFILSGRAFLHGASDLPSNIHLGICRDLIANPDFFLRPDKGCLNSGKCHYFSRGSAHITCAQWESGHPLLKTE
jgi:NADPH2 dehydrogenase